MKDIECPYCNEWQDIDHDDGYGYAEDVQHSQECGDCGKEFVYTTGIIFVYSGYKADCLNGGEHKYKPTITCPKEHTRMECPECGEIRQPTEEEMKEILKE